VVSVAHTLVFCQFTALVYVGACNTFVRPCMQLPPEEGAASLQVMVGHDHLRIALPSGPGGEDNYVLGMAMDFSSDTVGGVH
jgi:hypothetical protein